MPKKLLFTDGMVIHVHGEYRIVKLADGFYVVGGGRLIPVDSEEGAKRLIEKLKSDPT